MIAKHISFGTGSFTESYRLNDFIPFSKHITTGILCCEPIKFASSSRVRNLVKLLVSLEKIRTYLSQDISLQGRNIRLEMAESSHTIKFCTFSRFGMAIKIHLLAKQFQAKIGERIFSFNGCEGCSFPTFPGFASTERFLRQTHQLITFVIFQHPFGFVSKSPMGYPPSSS